VIQERGVGGLMRMALGKPFELLRLSVANPFYTLWNGFFGYYALSNLDCGGLPS